MGWIRVAEVVLIVQGSVAAADKAFFQAPRRIEVAHPAISLATGRFDVSKGPGIAAVHGNDRITVLAPDPWQESDALTFGNSCFQLRAADLDGDGDDDLGVADPGSVGCIFLSNGNGTFVEGERLVESTEPRAIIIGDWDEDGTLDIAIGGHASRQVALYRGIGDGSFVPIANVSTGNEEPHDLDAGDFDGDGHADILIAAHPNGILSLRGNGDGSFAPKPVDHGCCIPRFLASADFDRDGLSDLVCFSDDGLKACVCRGQGDGKYVKTQEFPGLSCLPARGDFDGDGIPDLVILPATKSSLTEIHLGKGDGQFRDPLTFGLACSNPAHALAVDLDLDGKTDVLAADGAEPAILVIRGEGKGVLDLPSTLGEYGVGKAFAIADLDRDGLGDILIASAGTGIEVFLGPGKGSPSPSPSASIATANLFSSLEALDLDGDGLIDLAGTVVSTGALVIATLDGSAKIREETTLPAGLFPGPVAAGRIDGDGSVDLAMPCSGAGHIAVFLNSGGGRFAAARIVPSIPRIVRIAIADLDRDGLADLAGISNADLTVHWGKGGGEFEAAAVTFTGKSLRDLAVSDVNADGLPDMAVCDTILREISIFRGKAGRGFEAIQSLDLTDIVTSITLADLDGSGLPAIVAIAQGTSSVLVFPNKGASGFGPNDRYGLGLAATLHRLADMNADGSADIVAFAPSKTVILFGTPRSLPFRRGEADGSGGHDLSDAVAILTSLFLGGGPLPCEDAADADDSGALDLADPIALLRSLYLGAGPLPPPYPGCGPDPGGEDGLGCGEYRGCG
jgi:hypothetical protein